MRRAGGPAGLGEVTVGVVLETLAAGAGRLSSQVCIRHLWALLTFSAWVLTQFALTILHLKLGHASASQVLLQASLRLPPVVPVGTCLALIQGSPSDAVVNISTQ